MARSLFLYWLRLVLAFHHQPGGQVGDADGGLGFIDVLAARPAGTEGIYLQVLWVDVDLHLISFRQDGPP